MSDWAISLGGWLVALFVAFVSGVVQWRKGSVDETALVLGKWKDLVEAHQSSITALHTQIASQAEEIADLRKRVIKLEERERELLDENAGLKRAIAQHSRSTAFQIGKQRTASKDRDERIDDLTARMDQAGGNGPPHTDG